MPQAFQLSPQTHEETIETANAPSAVMTPGAGLTDYEQMGFGK